MAWKYNALITEYCEQHDVSVPVGFGRRAASRYAVIADDGSGPSLVAKTWFNKEDIIHYLDGFAASRELRVLDFKERVELRRDSAKRLRPVRAL